MGLCLMMGGRGEGGRIVPQCPVMSRVHVYAATYPDVFSNQRRGLVARFADQSTEFYNKPNYPYPLKVSYILIVSYKSYS